MNVAVLSLCRDRYFYTRECFSSLNRFAGIPFAHIVIDNGSTDETPEWLLKEYKPSRVAPTYIVRLPVNEGISRASNRALDLIFRATPWVDIICKVDNDCLFGMENTLGQMAEIVTGSGPLGPKYVLSPRVTGIDRQPSRVRDVQLAGRRVGLTAIVGGLCHCVPAQIYREYRYPLDLPLAWGQDDHFCRWVKERGGQVGYVEDITVHHYEGTGGQALRYPAYFMRKVFEEGRRDG